MVLATGFATPDHPVALVLQPAVVVEGAVLLPQHQALDVLSRQGILVVSDEVVVPGRRHPEILADLVGPPILSHGPRLVADKIEKLKAFNLGGATEEVSSGLKHVEKDELAFTSPVLVHDPTVEPIFQLGIKPEVGTDFSGDLRSELPADMRPAVTIVDRQATIDVVVKQCPAVIVLGLRQPQARRFIIGEIQGLHFTPGSRWKNDDIGHVSLQDIEEHTTVSDKPLVATRNLLMVGKRPFLPNSQGCYLTVG